MKNESTDNRLRVAAYIRVSTDHPNQEDSYEMQERYFSDLLSANARWIPVGIYCDYGISATSRARRIGFQRLMRHCEEGKVDRIVCKSISRFARNTADFLRAIRVLREHAVTILFEKERIDTMNAENDFVLTALGAIAQEESRSISENIRWGMAKRYPKGDVVNFAIYGYRYAQGEEAYETTETGYVRRCVETVPEEAEVVRKIFQRVAEGRSFASIARELNREDIPAPAGRAVSKATTATGYTGSRITGRRDVRKKPDVGWTSERVSEIAHQERYAGDVLVQKNFTQDYLTHKIRRNTGELTQYYVKNHHPAIVDRALYEQVQEVLAAIEPQGGGTGRYPFSGRLICAHCGRTYYTRDRNRRPVWYCPSTALHNGKNICSAPSICEEQIIYMFRKAVLERFEMLEESVSEDQIAEDILSGRFAEAIGEKIAEDEKNKYEMRFSNFVNRLRQRMENFQKTDDIERERACLHHKVREAELEYVSACTHASEERRMPIMNEVHDISERVSATRSRRDRLRQLQEHMESYWEALEEDYECREKAIEWMAGLPDGKEGTIRFFDELADTWVKAFALSITVHSPERYTVRWFDDVETEVKISKTRATAAGKSTAACKVTEAGESTASGKTTAADNSNMTDKPNRIGVKA